MHRERKPAETSGTYLYRFEFNTLPLDAVAIHSDSFSHAIEEFKIMFGESSWIHLQEYLLQIVKIY